MHTTRNRIVFSVFVVIVCVVVIYGLMKAIEYQVMNGGAQ